MTYTRSFVTVFSIVLVVIALAMLGLYLYYFIRGLSVGVGEVDVPKWLDFSQDTSWLDVISSDPTGNRSGIGPSQSVVMLGSTASAPVCLSATNKSGSDLLTMPCTASDSQMFTYDTTDMSLSMGDNLCIDAHDNRDGEKLTVHDCNQSDPQKWMPFGDGTIKYNGTNRCISMPSGNPVGQIVQMKECKGDPTSKWSWNVAKSNDASNGGGGGPPPPALQSSPRLPRSSTIKYNSDSNMCWEISSGKKGFENGAKLHLGRCSGAPGQMFSYDPDTLAISLDGTNQCIDLHSAKNGQQLQSYQCNNTGPQHWSFSADGKIMYSGGGKNQCVDLHGGDTSAGAPINIYDCYDTPNQKWIPY